MADHPPTRASPRPPRRRWGWSVRIALSALVVFLFGFTLGAYLAVARQVETFTGGRVVDRPSGVEQSFSWPLRLTQRVNILVIGTDVTIGPRRQILPLARADSLLLVSVDPEEGKINALSIPRDTRAAIPGVGVTKINAAYAFGGPGLTIRAVEQLLGLRVDYYVKLGPASFARLVDAIGGVEVEVEKDMRYTDTWAGLRINLKKGLQVLDGAQAEGYIRFRHDALGDIGRVERQQKILLAIFRKLKNPAMLVRAPHLIRAFTDNTQTNLTLPEMMSLGMFALRLEEADIRTATLPGTFAPNFWEPDWSRALPLVLDYFHGVSPQVLAATTIELLNASGIPGLARRTASRLERLGFRIVRIGTATEVAANTVIIDRAGKHAVTRLLAEVLGKPRIVRQVQPADVDITVLLARDFAAVSSTLSRPPRP
ncbi:MAG: LCP family protein [Armatimonadota bacterium]|nr:LCP family protein [Armatimonadota bacterium]MDR7464605.1 LCP family protein [Armatimonadota bacterium]MDR7469010.1 LCP family protein [Armatimonadota bacterium]MDR7474057.1 LCP family protein [Armatimonadota bacterium]